MNNFDTIIYKAILLHRKGDLSKALKLYKELEKDYSNSYILNFYVGTLFLQNKNFEISKNYLLKSLKAREKKNKSILSAIYSNLSSISIEIKKFDDALVYINKAIEIDTSFVDGLLNRSKIFLEQNQFKNAEEDLISAQKIDPKKSEIFNEFGNLKMKLHLNKEAINFYEKSITLNNRNFYPYYNLGVLYQKIKNYKKSLEYFEKAKQINQNFTGLKGKIFHMRMYLSDWSNYEECYNEIINEDTKISPFISAVHIEEIDKQYQQIKNYVKSEFNDFSYLKEHNYKNNNIIKIGYFSSDFRNHATYHLFQDVLKNHNSNLFDIYGFYFGPTNNEEFSLFLNKNFKNYYDVSKWSDKKIIELSKSLNLNIAINMNGFTEFARNRLFEKKLAPIQINYLGYPGTMGVKFMDYIIADNVIIPENLKKFYTEKVLYMNQCYQPNKSINFKIESKLKKIDLGIPENSFLFCNFNNNYKITPKVFDAWMQILNKAQGSYLCLLKSNDISVNNLKRYAQKHGINHERLIFLPKLEYADHLRRFQFMDLFLDTYPCGAHTTASEAIRSGIPIITLQGNTFASRVASSILMEVELSSLITNSIDDYVRLAVDLFSNGLKLKEIKKNLNKNILKSSLFDPKLYTNNLEEIYKNICSKNILYS